MPLGLLAGLAGAGGLFSYNRENFFFDKQQQIKLEYQAQEMKIRQFELYREDVRDLVSLTTGKMENYLIVNTLQLGFCFTLFAEGRPKPGTDQWLVCLATLCNAGAFLYYLLSMWLAMHASVSAHAFGVRLLTQFVRLPVPGNAELDRARAIAQDYEGLSVRDLLRVPVWKQQLRRLQAAMEDRAQEAASDTGSDAGDSVVEVTDPAMNPVAMMKHVQMFRKLQANWQSYDAYARVCMAMGTNQLLHTLSYCTLGLLVHENNVPITAFSCVVIFTAGAFVLGKLDLYLSRRILAVAATLLVTPPVLTTIGMACARSQIGMFIWIEKVLIVIVFALHVAWIVFTVFVAKADSFDGVSLPTKFRSVLFLDVFGWLAEDDDQDLGQDAGTGADSANLQRGADGLTPVAENITFVMNEESAESDSLPQNVRPILLADCLGLQRQVSRDLQRWESDKVAQLLCDSRAERRELRRLRRLFDAVDLELTRVVGPGEQAAPAAASAEQAEALPVYLQLEWNPEGEPMAYYYQCETEETLWETPAERCRISELQSLERDVVELGNKVRALARCQCPASRPCFLPASGEAARSGSSLSAALLPDPPAQAEQPERSDFVEHSPGAAGTFHPQRGTARGGRGGRGGHLPGRLPWNIVLYGSQTLVAVWLIATIAVILSLSGVIRFDFEQPVSSELEPLGGLAQVAGPEAWPHRFPQPLGLACAPAAGPVALVAERYAVHELRLDTGEFASGPTPLTRALEACLSRVRGFQGRGLADVGLDCGSRGGDGSCSVTVLGADGQHALRCSLDTAAAGTATPLKLLGGPWQAHAPGGGNADWVLGGDRVPTQLRAHGSLEHVMLPALDLLEGDAVRIAALHTLGNHTLLGLESDGRLHAWPVRGGSVRSWRLPSAAGIAWTGLCATGGSLYLAGAAEGAGGAAGVWRVPLPQELRASPTERPAKEPTLAVGAWKVYLW